MRDNLTELIFSAGVVGCGGAGFPTHKKICGQVEDFIVNGVECEPLLRTDRYIMDHYARELVETVAAIGAFLQAKRCTIGVKRAYAPQVEALEAAIEKTFDLRPTAIIRDLDLRRPIYRQTAAYGHFGRNDLDLPWERTDRIDALKANL